MARKVLALTFTFFLFSVYAEKKFDGLNVNLTNLYRLSDAQTRSISPENFTGMKGKGGMAALEEGKIAGDVL